MMSNIPSDRTAASKSAVTVDNPVYIVPAAPGTKAHFVVHVGDEKFTDVRAIIAWRCRRDSFETVPVTVSNGKLQRLLPDAVEFADGRIEAFASKRTWSSSSDFDRALNP
jgi:hypothetical protein